MKNKIVWYLLLLTALIVVLILYGKLGYVAEHPSLNEVAEEPDIHIKNVGHYLKMDETERSIYHLNKAIEAIQKIETDVDAESIAGLDQAIKELEKVNDELWNDSVDTDHMYQAFEYTLNNLAHAELEVSEMYAETNHEDRSKLALKYAQMHVRNALLFQKAIYNTESTHAQIEHQVFQELDSLIANESLSSVQLTLKIDHIIKEIDQLIQEVE